MPEQKPEPIIQSRFKRTLIQCSICNKPMGERLGNKWWFMTGNKLKFAKTAVIMGQDTPYGEYRVKCPDPKCEGGHIFAWIN